MNREEIFAIFKQQLLEIIPELSTRNIMIDDSLKALGANSLDRAEVIIQTMAALHLKIPLVQFGQAKNIAGLIDVFEQNVQGGKS